MRDNVRAQPDLLAGGRREQRRAPHQSGYPLPRNRLENAANVVRVEAAAGGEIELGLVEGAQHDAALGLEQELVGRAGEARDVRVVAGSVVFFARAHDAAQPARPVRGVLDIGPEIHDVRPIGLAVEVHRRDLKRRAAVLFDRAVVERRPPQGVLLVHERIIVPELETDRGVGRNRPHSQGLGEGAGAAKGGAGLVLLLLVPVHRIIEEVGEVVPQRHRALDGVGVETGLPVLPGDAVVA